MRNGSSILTDPTGIFHAAPSIMRAFCIWRFMAEFASLYERAAHNLKRACHRSAELFKISSMGTTLNWGLLGFTVGLNTD